MASQINASNSGFGGIVQTGDSSGQLQLQTAGTTAVTLDTSQNATFAGYINTPNTFGFKNRIINGAMVIDQRNAGASINPTDGQFSVDRFMIFRSQASKLTAQQNAGSVTPPAGFSNYLGITSSSAYTVTSGDYFMICQRIEGYNMADLAWGTASAKTVTLSFWVRSSLTGTFGGSLQNGSQNRAYPFTYTISSANTWEQKTITITGCTDGTWSSTNTEGIGLYFGLGVGSTYGNGTAGAWASSTYYSATGATSVVGTNGATLYITGVQLEKGSTATSFDYRSYGTELQLCQRYFNLIDNGAVGVCVSTTAIQLTAAFPVQMRAAPSTMSATTMRITDYYVNDYTSTNPSVSVSTSSNQGFRINASNFTGLTTGRAITILPSGTSAAPIQSSAEL